MIGKEVMRGLKKNKIRFYEGKLAFKEQMRISHKVNSEVRNFRIPVVLQDREHAFFWKMVIKAISHKVRIPVHFRTEILGRDREHAFGKCSQK